MTTGLFIRGALIFDPVAGTKHTGDVRIRDRKISEIGANLKSDGEQILEADGLWLFPGLIDMHVHLREPGQESKETIATGTQAAAHGGFTTVVAMANTSPVIDDKTGVQYVMRTAQTHGIVNVYQVGAISKDLKGEEMADLGEMVQAGAVAFSDDGRGVMNAMLMRRAMQYSTLFDVPIIAHCENHDLSEGGVINEGYTSTATGLPGIPREAEITEVARDCILAEHTGARLHLAHISCAESIDLIRHFKKRGVNVTAETAAHYLLLTERALETYDTNAKMNPPLRTEEDRQILIEALRDGTIDVIASDHAPHTPGQKDQEFDQTPFGIVGLETTLPLLLTYLIQEMDFDPLHLVKCMTVAPRNVLKLKEGTLNIGAPADITLWNPNKTGSIEKDKFQSKSRNTPFEGWDVEGRVCATIVAGNMVYACPEGPAAKLQSVF